MAEARIRGVRLTREERLAVRRLISGGCSFEEAAAAVRCSTKTVQRLLNTVGGMPPRKPTRSKRHLSLAEREEVSRGLGSGASYRAIARRLGRAPSTISREVHGNGGPRRYRACRADEAAYKRARRPKATKFRQCPRLRTQVESMLNTQWSPQQISARLPVDYPDDPEMRVSHETIYRSLFVQARGALRKELTACLRSGRTRRRPHGRKDPGGYIKEMVLIADRPAEIEDRAVPGHCPWATRPKPGPALRVLFSLSLLPDHYRGRARALPGRLCGQLLRFRGDHRPIEGHTTLHGVSERHPDSDLLQRPGGTDQRAILPRRGGTDVYMGLPTLSIYLAAACAHQYRVDGVDVHERRTLPGGYPGHAAALWVERHGLPCVGISAPGQPPTSGGIGQLSDDATALSSSTSLTVT